MMPLITWEDGAWIGRIANTEDIKQWLTPLAARPVSPSWWEKIGLDESIQLQEEPVFIYVDSENQPQASLMLDREPWGLNQPSEPLQIRDLGGPGLGTVTDPLAKRRITGFVYEDLLPEAIHPFDRDAGAILGIPWVVADKTFSRSRISNRISQWKRAKDSFLAEESTIEELRAFARDVIRLKITRKNFFGGLMSIYNLPWDDPILGIVAKMSHELLDHHRNESIAVLLCSKESKPRKLWWEVRRTINREDGANWTYHYQDTLGTHEQGPLEALHAAGIFMPESELEDWLDEHADFDGKLTFSPELYSALSLKNPMLWDLEKFKTFDETLKAQQEGY
jgi:hypothetical protein